VDAAEAEITTGYADRKEAAGNPVYGRK